MRCEDSMPCTFDPRIAGQSNRRLEGPRTLPDRTAVLTGNAAPNKLRTTVLAANADAATGKYMSMI